jgi:dipeptidyl-peptidase-4
MRMFALAAMSLAGVVAGGSNADELTVERIFADPNLNGPTLRGLKVSPDGVRVTFLRGREDDQNRQDLWEYHIESAQMRRLVDADSLGSSGEISSEEEARRERLRIAALTGIVDYVWAPDGSALLFPLDGSLFHYALPDGPARKLADAADGFVTDPKIAPDGRHVAFVRAQNLHIVALDDDVATTALTEDGGGTVSNGTAEFIAQEEMDRHTGYWWSPDGKRIAFTRIDEARVPMQRRFEIQAGDVDIIEQRYPATGQNNVDIRLGVVTIADDDNDGEREVAWIDLGPSTDIYLPRVNWRPDSAAMWFQRQSRNQRRLELIEANLANGRQRILLTETSETWINLSHDLEPLADGGFVWSSERDGYRHLYVHDEDGSRQRQLTRGEWVVDEILAIDATAKRAYFAANRDDPLSKQVYAVPIDGGDIERITDGHGWHDAVFAENAAVFVDTFSDPGTPPNVSVRKADGGEVAVLLANALDDTHPYAAFRDTHSVPEFGTLASEDGQALHWRLYKPHDFDDSKRYPVFVRFYGGPGRQLATKAWGDLFDQYMTRRGYLVFTLDNRGTPRRGTAFENPIFRGMGDVEARDQRVGIDHLRTLDYVDPERIGVFGWSYGGYMALMMLAKSSDVIAAGASVAPVTDWMLYDTHYTERYMDHPQRNAEGYGQASLWPHLDGLTSRLLLVHGMADDNVLFTHTTELMNRLQQRGTAFDLMTYPGGKHGLSQPWMRTHVYTAIADFFDRHLKREAESMP